MRLLVATVAAAILLCAPASAPAAVRYAMVGGTGVEPCATPPPGACPITTAMISTIPAGTEVIIAPGTYDDGGSILTAFNPNLNIHGQDGSPRPVITTMGTGTVMSLIGSGNTVRHLDLRQKTGAIANSIALALGPTALVDDVAVTNMASPLAVGIQVSGGDVVRNSTVLMAGTQALGVAGATSSGAPAVTLLHDTVWAMGTSSVGIQASAWCIPFDCTTANAAYALSLRNVLVRGAGADLQAQVTSTRAGSMDVQYSDYTTVAPMGGAITQSHSTGAAPLLVNPAGGDFHELPGSLTIDAGALQAGDAPLDPDGRLRALGPATDIGAYEAPAPILSGVTVTATAAGSALVTGTVDAQGDSTSVVLRYGLDTTYAASTLPKTVTGFGPVAVSLPVTGLNPAATYHLRLSATDSFTTADSADLVLAPTAATPGGPGGPVETRGTPAPVISSFKLSPARFRVRPAATSKAKSKSKTASGSRFLITLSTAANLKVTITHTASGIRVGKSCVAPSRKHRRGTRCTRTLTNGSLPTAKQAAGSSTLAFTGRVGSRALPAGRYTATAIATGLSGSLHSAARSAKFTIVSH